MIDFRIQTFLAVCRTMNFTHAADELHITQPAVSQHIHFLEQLYGTKLFAQNGKRMQLTPQGRLLLETMSVFQNDENLMRQKMQELDSEKHKVTFGVTMTIGEYVIADPLAAFLHSHPDTDVHIRYGNTQQLLACLRNGEIDFALIEGYFSAELYDSVPYSTEDYIAVAAPSHVFAKDVKILRDLLPERLLLREEGSGTRDILEKNLAVRNLSVSDFRNLSVVENMHTIIQLLLRDCGITFLYKAAVRDELAAGRLTEIPLADFRMSHDFTFIWNRGSAFAGDYRNVISAFISCS